MPCKPDSLKESSVGAKSNLLMIFWDHRPWRQLKSWNGSPVAREANRTYSEPLQKLEKLLQPASIQS